MWISHLATIYWNRLTIGGGNKKKKKEKNWISTVLLKALKMKNRSYGTISCKGHIFNALRALPVHPALIIRHTIHLLTVEIFAYNKNALQFTFFFNWLYSE